MRRVGVVGAHGRMGRTTCEAVEAAADLDLVAAVDRDDPLERVVEAGAEVAVEFSLPTSVAANAAALLDAGVHVVVGATGLTDADLDDLRARTGPASCLVAPNFSIGAVLMMRLAAEAAAHLPDVEITEAHHPGKADAPSGTALRTARLVAEARSDRPRVPGPDGHPARGEQVDGVPVHSVRLPGFLASQEVVLGGEGQRLTIRHDALDRSSFMPGVLLAVRSVDRVDGLAVGLETLL